MERIPRGHISSNKKFVTDFKVKVKIFNSFFAKQCFTITNNNKFPSNFVYITQKHLETVKFSSDNIGKIIQALAGLEKCTSTRMIFRARKFIYAPDPASKKKMAPKIKVNVHV